MPYIMVDEIPDGYEPADVIGREEYDKVIKQLNPEYAEKEQQRDEINSLKEQMAQMSQNMAALMQANTTLIEKLSKKEN